MDTNHFDEDVSTSEQFVFVKRIMQNKVLIKFVSQMVNINTLRDCVPRIYKFEPNSGQKFNWHGDNINGRTIGFSVNLTKEKFEGGYFKIRNINDPSIFYEIQNHGYGDAIFFNIGLDLQHCVTEISGQHARYACAGWFIT
ncbi:MAG: 2OG-Fe(II) oxygenase [Bacteriovoracaceae bacterium]|nr:2OG-Fe(II) oxygenase [Bacteriovoracaceae bacterium]